MRLFFAILLISFSLAAQTAADQQILLRQAYQAMQAGDYAAAEDVA